MPRLPIDHSKTVMYKLMCKNPQITPIYIGKTTNFPLRKSQHKRASKTDERYVYSFIRDNGGFNNWDMVLIEEYPCKNKCEGQRREMELIVENGARLNADA